MIRFILAFLALSGAALGATTHTAASATYTDVAAKIADASVVDGDTVVIPATTGTENWSSVLTVSKLITIKGTGYSNAGTPDDPSDDTYGTTIGHNITSGSRKMFYFTGVGTQRLQELSIVDGSGGAAYTGTAENGVIVNDSNSYLVIERCGMIGLGCSNIVPYGYGVAANCRVELVGLRMLVLQNGNVDGGASSGDPAWQSDAGWGTNEFFFVEDCSITQSTVYGWFDGWQGGKIHARHNTITGARMGNHGTESAQRIRSHRAIILNDNVIANPTNKDLSYYIDIRGGTALIYNNTITGRDLIDINMNNYRVGNSFPPWGVADGTKAWDGNDTTDDSGTPGGAGDGVFESGTITSTGSYSLTDSSKSWTPTDKWEGYSLVAKYSNTATSGGVGSVVVTGAGWNTNAWADFEILQVSTGARGKVSSNTGDTLTLSSSFHRPTFSASNAFVLSRSSQISASTGTTLTVVGGTDAPSWPSTALAGATTYDIRRVSWVLDGPGRGMTNAISGSPANHQDLSQDLEPIYIWNNTDNGGAVEASIGSLGGDTIQLNRDYYLSAAPGYTEYTYPHPLRSDAAPDTTAPTLSSASINAGTLTLAFSEAVEDVVAAAWTISGRTVSSAVGSGTTWTMTVSAAAAFGDTITVSYTPGIVVDTASNALAAISSRAVTNNTPDPGDPSVRNVGRRASAGRIMNK